MEDTITSPASARENPRVSGRTLPPRKFSRHIRQLFVFLVVLVAITNISSLILLDRLMRDEAHRVRDKLKKALDQLEIAWVTSPPEERDNIDLDRLADVTDVGRMAYAVKPIPDQLAAHWDVHVTRDSIFGSGTGDQAGQAPVFPVSGMAADGEYWEFYSSVETWAGHNVIVSAGVPAPRLHEMKQQLTRELWIRAAVFVAFGLFAVLFYRLVLLPFRDMRRRAAALMQSGVLPDDLAAMQDDPEYVMGTFDVLVHELLARADEFKRRAVHSERRARDLERFNEFMLSSLSTGVIILNRHGRILEMNPSAERILGVRGVDVDGLSCAEADMPREMIALIDEGLRDGYTYTRRELRIDQADSTKPRYLGLNTSLILDDHGDVIGLSVLLSDITEIKHLYDELAENQRLADLGEMSAGLAHQLRNSTAAILGYGKLLIGKIGQGTVEQNWAEAIVEETHETEVMLTKFLDFARPLNADRTVTDLNDVVREAIQSLQRVAEEQCVRLTLTGEGCVPSTQVVGDALLLKQVLINLIQNAIEAIPETGSVAVSVETTPRKGMLRGEVRVTVSDTGVGIADDDQARIFHPFHTTKEQGTGLGLPLAKKIAILHGGNLTLQATSPMGSTFVLMIPLAESTSEPMKSLSWKPDAVESHLRGGVESRPSP